MLKSGVPKTLISFSYEMTFHVKDKKTGVVFVGGLGQLGVGLAQMMR